MSVSHISNDFKAQEPVLENALVTSSTINHRIIFPLIQGPAHLYADSQLGGEALQIQIMSGTLPICKPEKRAQKADY